MHHAVGARFIAVTDHDRVTDLTKVRSAWPDTVFLEGFEWSASQNILFIGEKVPALYRYPLKDALLRASDLLTVICHPKPSKSRDYWTVAMIAALEPAPMAMEVFNAHYGRWHRVYPDPNPLYTDIWDALLTRGMHLWGFADDDSHDPADYGCTLTMACVQDFSPGGLMSALKAGRFYGSTGLLLESVHLKNGKIEVELSSAASGRFVGPHGKVLASANDRAFSYQHDGEAYVRFEAEGEEGRIFLQPFFAED